MRGYKRNYGKKAGFSLAAVTRFIMKRKYLFAGIAVAAVVVIVLFATGVFAPRSSAEAMAQSDATATVKPGEDPYINGTESDGPSEAEATATPSGDVSDKGHIIGISVLSPNVEDYQLLAYIDKAANEAIEAKQIDDFLLYNAKGDDNQQLQDVLAMINEGANTVVVMGTKNENFQKISELCNENKVKIVACNVDATTGFSVNIRSQSNHAQKFAEFAKQSGAAVVHTVDASETEVSAINAILHVDANINGDDATANISERLSSGATIQDLMFFDNSANSVLKMYIKNGIVPNSIATPAYVGFIKTWYNLLNGGVVLETETTEDESEDESVDESEDEESASASPSASASASSGAFKSTPDKFHAIAYTQAQNLGEIVYKFAYYISSGKSLPSENYIYDSTGEEYITNENIAQYYAKIGSLADKDILPSMADTSGIDALFQ